MVFSVFLSCKGSVTGICFGVPVCTTIKRQDRDERYLEHSNLFWFLTWKTKQGLNVFHSLVMVCYTGVSMLYQGCCWNGLALGSHTHTHTFMQAGRHAHYTGMQFRYIWYMWATLKRSAFSTWHFCNCCKNLTSALKEFMFVLHNNVVIKVIKSDMLMLLCLWSVC